MRFQVLFLLKWVNFLMIGIEYGSTGQVYCSLFSQKYLTMSKNVVLWSKESIFKASNSYMKKCYFGLWRCCVCNPRVLLLSAFVSNNNNKQQYKFCSAKPCFEVYYCFYIGLILLFFTLSGGCFDYLLVKFVSKF